MFFFCAMHLSSPPLPCGSVVLQRVIETERCRCWVSDELCCVCESLRTNVMSALCSTLSNTATCSSSFEWLYISLPVSPPVLPISLCHPWVGCASPFAPSYLLSPDHPSSNFAEKVNAAPLAAAESALMLPGCCCHPRPACILSHSPSLPPSLPRSLARHIEWPLTAASATRSNSDITPLYMSLQFLPK